jgi:glycosyltransferase involved in cell wall biosynthesis
VGGATSVTSPGSATPEVAGRPGERPLALIVGPLPPPPGGVGVQVEAILRSPLAERWRLECFNVSKPQQEGKPSTVTPWDVLWSLWHLAALPVRLLRSRPAVALVQSTADTGYFRDLALALECRALGVPVVLHWHGAPDSPQFPGRSPWRRWLFGFGTRRAARVIVIAESYREFFARHVPAERLAVVPNFIDGERFAAARRCAASEPPPATEPPTGGPVTALFVGRVGPQKGADVLLAALEEARRRAPSLRAVLVGDGESRQAFEEVARHPLVAAGIVRLTGALGAERVEEYRRADLFVLPTRADSLPLSLLEAMAAGLPAIASDVGAIRWVLDDGGCGVVVPPADASALADALVTLAGDPAARARLGERARQRQMEYFDSRSAAESLDAVLRPAARAPQAPPRNSAARGRPRSDRSVDGMAPRG